MRYVCRGCGDMYAGYHGCGKPSAPPVSITVDQPIYLTAVVPTDAEHVSYRLQLDRRQFWMDLIGAMSSRGEFACSRERVRAIANTMLALADKMDDLEERRKASV